MKTNLSPAERNTMLLADLTFAALAKPAAAPHPTPATREQADQTSNWAPLVNLIGEHLTRDFMFMGEAEGIFLYKHSQTRQYLNIDKFGQTYSYNGNCRGYNLINRQTAIVHAFDLNSGLLTERDRGHLVAELAKVLGRPTEGSFASFVWEWSNSRNTPSDLAARTMREAGYTPFEGYPLVRQS